MCESKLENETVIKNKCQVKGCANEAITYRFTCQSEFTYYGLKYETARPITYCDKTLCQIHFDQRALKDFELLFYKTKVLEVTY